MTVRPAQSADIDAIILYADEKRSSFSAYAPMFHNPAEGAAEIHRPWITRLIADTNVGTFVHDDATGNVDGFVIATLVDAPPVYDPGGATCSIDDFLVATPSLWPSVGKALLETAQAWASQRGAVQTVVVCHAHDPDKQTLLTECGLQAVSLWYTAPL